MAHSTVPLRFQFPFPLTLSNAPLEVQYSLTLSAALDAKNDLTLTLSVEPSRLHTEITPDFVPFPRLCKQHFTVSWPTDLVNQAREQSILCILAILVGDHCEDTHDEARVDTVRARQAIYHLCMRILHSGWHSRMMTRAASSTCLRELQLGFDEIGRNSLKSGGRRERGRGAH